MLTTLTEKVRVAFKREPLAFCLLVFLVLGGAGAGMTARNILTASPPSGSVNLATGTGAEGTSTALMRSDATLGVTGILPVLNGGTGSSTFPPKVSLQASAPGTPDTGNSNISGVVRGGLFTPTSSITGAPQWGVSGNAMQWKTVGNGGSSYSFDQTNGQSVSCASASSSALNYFNLAANGSTFAGWNECGRIKVGSDSSGGGITSSDGTAVGTIVNTTGTVAYLDSGSFAVPATTAEYVWRNNNIDKAYMRGDGSFQQVGVSFASLAAQGNGSQIYCSNCTRTDPCAASGTGAIARRLNGAWSCGDIAGTPATLIGTTSGTFTPGSLGGNLCTSITTFTVTGAAQSDSATCQLPTTWTQGIVPYCFVSGTNSVIFNVCNATTGAITPTSGTYGVRVLR